MEGRPNKARSGVRGRRARLSSSEFMDGPDASDPVNNFGEAEAASRVVHGC